MVWLYSLIVIFIYSHTAIAESGSEMLLSNKNLFYFCTAANEKFYPHLLNLIGSIHRHNFYELGHIAIFDLGLLPEQKSKLASIEKVSIHKIEATNPQILQKYYTQPNNSKPVPGWYSWKPVAIKQAFDLFPPDANILWIDAGTTILKDISPLFKCIEYQGYFFHNGWNWPLKRQTTQFVINSFELNFPENRWLLADTIFSLEAGLMGLTRKVYDNFVIPMYELSKDIRYFADDGSAPEGFGYARHDQPLFSIYAQQNGYNIINHFEQPKESFEIPINAFEVEPFHIASLPRWQTKSSHICCSRNNLQDSKVNIAYIYYKNGRLSTLRKIYHGTKNKLAELFIAPVAGTKAYLRKLF